MKNEIIALIVLLCFGYIAIGITLFTVTKDDNKIKPNLRISVSILWVLWFIYEIIYYLYIAFRELFKSILGLE